MKNPVSTYRVQLNPEFTFQELQKIVDYLGELGVSTVYSAPFFQAREGSSHGYDITDPFVINKEIGTLKDFRRISTTLRQKGMSWLQDIVPNHMAFDGANIFLQEIFELGPKSDYYNFFDIDWTAKEGKVTAPFLGDPLDVVLQKGELQLKLLKNNLVIKYFDHEYPVSFRSYPQVFEDSNWDKNFENFNGNSKDWKSLKNAFFVTLEKDNVLREKLNEKIKQTNASEEKLREFLKYQFFLPEHWKKTEEEINYRRFFTINDLICLRMEDSFVFEHYHKFILELCEQKLIQGLRIDHVDGLFDPKTYLENLRSILGPDFYIIIEKILEWDEKLPSHWPVQGTSGYAFLAEVNQVMTMKESEELFTKKYHRINPKNAEYSELVYKQKLFILEERMGGEYENLWNLAQALDLLEEEVDTPAGKAALGAFLAAFPVYRIYPEEFPLRKRQKKILETAFQNALQHFPELKKEMYYLKKLFLGEADKNRENMLFFLQRCQQFTGPLAAKGVEDTSFYIFNKLISHNEVGDSPENFGISISRFHQKMEKRQEDFPNSINATATHDTKRGEDARMRINVLSEIGEEWFQKVEYWREISSEIREQDNIPDSNEEYFIYQMLVGHWPFQENPGKEFLDRSKSFLQKMLREAKEHSSWAQPNEKYENGVYNFLETLLKNDNFLTSFIPFQQKITAYGVIKSLSQSVIKLTAPGIPDVYQGTELWDLNYVDPDNRRPVDYKLRQQYLKEIKTFKEKPQENLRQLKAEFSTGKIKFFTLHKSLVLRNDLTDVFEEGEYLPLQLETPFDRQILAYARRKNNNYVLIFAPLMVTEIFDENLKLVTHAVKDKVFIPPKDFPVKWENIFTGASFSFENGLNIHDLFQDLPVAIFKNYD